MRHATISQTCSLSRGPLRIGLNHRFSHILGLISQQEVPGGVFPFLKLLQVHIFNLPPERNKKVEDGHNEDTSPLCQTLSIAFSNKKLFGARVAVKTPEKKLFQFSSLSNDFPPWVPSMDQPLIIYIIPGIIFVIIIAKISSCVNELSSQVDIVLE